MCYEYVRHNKEPLKSVQGNEQFDYFVTAFLKHLYWGGYRAFQFEYQSLGSNAEYR